MRLFVESLAFVYGGVYKKVASSHHISAVNLIVGWCLFACSMNFWTTSLIECVKYADEDRYPNIRVLLIIGCTLPVSSAETVRSFSGLRRIKSYRRNMMPEERLSGLALMCLHHDLNINIDNICTTFVAKQKRRCSRGVPFTIKIHVHGEGAAKNGDKLIIMLLG